MKKTLIAILLTCMLLAGCVKPPIEEGARGVSNILFIGEDLPVKVAACNDYDTIVKDGVVMHISELSYMEWDRETDQDKYSSTGVVSLPRRSIKVILYADWFDLAGGADVHMPQLDTANAQQVMESGQVLMDAANSSVAYEPNMQKANSRIIYEWFPPTTDGFRPSILKLPLSFSGSDGKQVDITMDVEVKDYPW